MQTAYRCFIVISPTENWTPKTCLVVGKLGREGYAVVSYHRAFHVNFELGCASHFISYFGLQYWLGVLSNARYKEIITSLL